MSISIDSASMYSDAAKAANDKKLADNLKSTLKNGSSSDDDLMKSCKNFEAYMMEQVFKSMESTVEKSEDEENDDYLNQFGDMQYEEYAKAATENQSTGLAKMLYDSMKRSANSTLPQK